MRISVAIVALMIAGFVVGAVSAKAQQEVSPPTSVVRQSLDDAWWTAPCWRHRQRDYRAGIS